MVVSRAMQGMETAEGNRRPRSGRRVVADVQRPASATALPGGGVLIDFGRDAFGWAEVAAPAGDYVVRLGEKLGADGRIDLDPGGTIRAAEAAFRSRGTGFGRVPLAPDRVVEPRGEAEPGLEPRVGDGAAQRHCPPRARRPSD